MRAKLLIIVFILAAFSVFSFSCDYYYENPNFHISYVEVYNSPVYVPSYGGDFEVVASISNSDWYTNCYYDIVASSDRYFSYDDQVLYSGTIFFNSYNEQINKVVNVPSTFSSGSFYVGVHIKNSLYDEVRFTEFIAFQKYDYSLSGSITVVNDSSDDVDVYIDNKYVGGAYAGGTLVINDVLYGSRLLYAEARYNNNVWGPRTINFSGNYYWTLNNYYDKCSITYDNYTSESINVYLNGLYKGKLNPYDVMTVYDVGNGSHKLYGESLYSYWGPTWIYLDPGESYTWELWP